VSDFGPKPKLDWIATAKCAVDSKYQRDTGSRRSRNLIDKIVAGFKWSRFGIVLVVRHAGGFHVVDGQHRVEACRTLGIETLPAVILPHSDIAAAAADFVAINRDRVTVTPLHIHYAELAAGSPRAVALARVCAESGVELCRYPVPRTHLKPGQTLAVGTIAKVLADRGEDGTIALLRALRRAKGGDVPGAIHARAIRDAHMNGVDAAVAGARRCLSCDRPFQSEGRGHRLCSVCTRAA
jgi:hypothetical protein